MPSNGETSLRDKVLTAAYAQIEAVGVERLSFREIARSLGVSHQAPYRHFPSKNHILAEIVARLYRGFATQLSDIPDTGDPMRDLRAMGQAYLAYASDNPLAYRLMFNTALPPAEDHPEMVAEAAATFGLLQARLAAMPLRKLQRGADAEADAMFIWSALHGLASILQSDASAPMALTEAARERITIRLFDRIGAAIGPGAEDRC